MLDHERLEVYHVARELSREACRLMKKARGKAMRTDLVDQVWRATASIPLNTAEGTGEESKGRKAYFYRVARGSAAELSAALDHMVDMNMLSDHDITTAKSLIVRIVSMLFKLTRSVTIGRVLPSEPKSASKVIISQRTPKREREREREREPERERERERPLRD